MTTTRDRVAMSRFIFEMADPAHLNSVLAAVRKVDGVFDKDPEIHRDAVFFPSISYMDVINKDLRVMDITAITLCKENNLPVVVFNLRGKNNMKKVVQGKQVGTIVRRQA